MLAVLISGTAAAGEIYRWHDADGLVHYSDEKPREDVAVTTIEIDASLPADYDPVADPYSIRNQARRLNETWTALAQARSEREQARRQSTQSPAAPPPYYYLGNESYHGPYGYRYPWPYYPPPIHVRPAHPGAGRRQLHAMEALELTGPRPPSINSGAHYERVQRSRVLPTLTTGKPRPLPQR